MTCVWILLLLSSGRHECDRLDLSHSSNSLCLGYLRFEGKMPERPALEQAETCLKSIITRILVVSMDKVHIFCSISGSVIVYFWIPTLLAWQLQVELSEHQENQMQKLFFSAVCFVEVMCVWLCAHVWMSVCLCARACVWVCDHDWVYVFVACTVWWAYVQYGEPC